MASYSFTDLRDRVLLWIHGRRLGIRGDGASPSAVPGDALVLDGVVIGATRSGANAIKVIAAGVAAAGPVTIAGVLVGDHVEMVLLSTFSDSSASFETTVSVAGQVQQTSASNLSGNTYLFFVQPQS